MQVDSVWLVRWLRWLRVLSDAVSPGTLPNDTCSEPGGTLAPTITDPRFRTYRDTAHGGDWTRRNPWRSPGQWVLFTHG